MGQCVSIQVGPNANSNDHAKHIHNSKRSSKKGSKRVRNRGDESTDAETTDDDEIANEQPQICDPNFGKAQSPINIFTDSTHECCATPMAHGDVESNPLRFNYPDLVRECTIINTGHTVQVNIPEHSKCSVWINNKQYNLVQFHFHTPSEHMLNDVQFEMEMHLVHATPDGELAVLGFIFTTKTEYFKSAAALANNRKDLIKETQDLITGKDEVEEAEEDPVHQETIQEDKEEEVKVVANVVGRARGESVVPGNDFLEQFWMDLPLKKTDEPVALSGPISFDYLFECASKTFKRSVETNEILLDMDIFEYPGSLTTPPYSEGVHWMVSRKMQFINVRQLNKLSSCWGHHNNARECQDYCGRKVQIRSNLSMRGYFFQ